MRYLLCFILLFVSLAYADTVAERVTELEAAPGVGAGNVYADTANAADVPNFTSWKVVRVTYVYTSGDTVEQNTIALGVKDLGTGTEAAYYFPRKPTVLNAETKFVTSRTVGGWAGLTAAQQLAGIETFCNGVYKKFNPGSADIREFQCTPVNGSTIKVSGYFDKGTTWTRETWFIRLIDPNGSVAPDQNGDYTNIEFQQATN